MTVSQERIQQFADATGDHQWIHVDEERARTGPFGTTIAHGFLTLSLVPQFFDTMKIPHRTLTEKTAIEDFKWVAETFMKQRSPVALVITKGVVKGLHP